MANLFFRTNVAPYRIDTYNALHEKLNCEFYFLYAEDSSQKFDMQKLYDQCNFKANILQTISLFGKRTQKICTNLRQIIKSNKPEIIIVPEFKILTVQVLLYRWLTRGKYKVISMCDDSWDMIAHDHEWTLAHKWMRKLITPFLDNLLLVDDRVVNWYKETYSKGIWMPIIRSEEREALGYERTLPMSKKFSQQFNLIGKKVLLFVGRLDPVKNLEKLFLALSKTKEDFVTIIVGSGQLEETLKMQASTINKPIVFTGRYEGDSIRAWYNLADVFVLASKMEAFGAVTNEALIAGCTCLVSQNAGSACLINGDNGSIIDPYDVDSMATIIDETMQAIKVRKEITPRPCKMAFTFEETIDRVINELKTL